MRPLALAAAANAPARLRQGCHQLTRRLTQADSAGAPHAAVPGTRRHPQDPGDGGKAAIRGEASETDALSRVDTAPCRVQVEFSVCDTPEWKSEAGLRELWGKILTFAQNMLAN